MFIMEKIQHIHIETVSWVLIITILNLLWTKLFSSSVSILQAYVIVDSNDISAKMHWGISEKVPVSLNILSANVVMPKGVDKGYHFTPLLGCCFSPAKTPTHSDPRTLQ